MRLAIGGISHETNAALQRNTVRADFEITRGDEIFVRRAGRTYVGGMLAAAEQLRAEVVGTLHAYAFPSGVIRGDDYQLLKDELLEALCSILPVDAVALDLHGAGAAEGVPDLEGDLCAAVREVVGPKVPLVVTHDLHGHVTDAEMAVVDLALGVHHYPHDDMFERGAEAVLAVPRLLAGEWRPVSHVERLPLLVPPLTTYTGAGQRALAICQDAERAADVLDCTFMHGFPFTDSALHGAQVVVTTNAAPDLARTVAREVADKIWEMREEMTVEHPQPDEAVRRALAFGRGPVVLNETSDNPGGGAPCDGTHLLRALIAARPAGALFAGIRDPQVVDQAWAAGEGATIDVTLGGKTDALHGDPLEGLARVVALTDGDVRLRAPMGGGGLARYGRTALLELDGVRVIVISQPEQVYDDALLASHGVDPASCSVICLKSSHHFRSGWERVASAVVTTDPPGVTTQVLRRLPHLAARGGLFPVDGSVVYPSPLA